MLHRIWLLFENCVAFGVNFMFEAVLSWTASSKHDNKKFIKIGRTRAYPSAYL